MEDIDILKGFIISSKRRYQLLKLLSKKPLRPMEICNKLELDAGNVTRLLIQLEQKNLIKCLTPGKKSWRVYSITPLGKEIFIAL